MQGKPVAVVAVVHEESLKAATKVTVGHAAKVARAKPLDPDQQKNSSHVDDGKNKENDEPDVQEDENLLVYDVLRKKAQRVQLLNIARVSELVEEALGLRWEEPSRVLREGDQIVAEQS